MQTQGNSPTVLYISGYGRSGSTILDMLLGMHPDIFGGGELAHSFDEWRQNRVCSCLQRYDECSFWTQVVQTLHVRLPGITFDEALRITRQVEAVPHLHQPLGSHLALNRQYADIWHAVMRAIAETGNVSAIVDSSKSTRLTAQRAVALAKLCRLDVKVIHLYRDPRAVMWSSLRGANRKLEAGYAPGKSAQYRGGLYRVLVSWLTANLGVHFSQMVWKMPVVRVSYESLVSQPLTELERIGEALALDLDPVVAMLEANRPLDAGHGIAGNRLRRQGIQRLEAKNEWQAQLPPHARKLAWLSWPLAYYYGYKLK